MSEKKNIDRLFREKFKDFEVAPPEMVWDNIKQELQQEEKKRRIIPLWFRLSGVAAILVIGLLLVTPLFNNVNVDVNRVVTRPENDSKRIEPVRPLRQREPVIEKAARSNNAVVTTEDAPETETPSSTTEDATVPNSRGGIRNRGDNNNPALNSRSNVVAYEKGNPGTAAKDRQGNNRGDVVKRGNTIVNANEAVANSSNKSRDAQQKQDNTITAPANATGTEDIVKGTEREAVAIANDDKNGNVKNSEGQNTPEDNNTVSPQVINRDIPVDEAVAETATDTTALVPENELEKLRQEMLAGKDKEEEAIAEADSKGKWNIKPQLAPVFYNSFSDGSPIDAQFAGNSKEYDNNLSYGVGINYALNDRLTIRSGINTVNLSYATNDIQFHASLNEQTNNVARRSNQANIVVQNQGASPFSTNTAGLAADQLPIQTFNGSLIQEMGYIEVPLEMSYALVNKKFGIDIIGGVSTLFLNENNVSVISDQGYSATVGEAQNLNNVHFSTNVGVGFRYRFWKAFEANFEPTFKYQVNPFSSAAGNFKPYFIGLYSGISFSF